MVAKLSKNFLIGVIGLMTLILVACIFYIVRDNMSARTRYSVKTFTPQGEGATMGRLFNYLLGGNRR